MRNLFWIIILALTLWVQGVFAQTQGMIYRDGTVDITVPANQYVTVFTTGSGQAKVFKATGGIGTNMAPDFALETTNSGIVQNAEVVFGPYTTGATLRIQAGVDTVWYSVGALAAIIPCLKAGPAIVTHGQLAPVTQTTTATLLATDLLSGIITGTQSSGATVTYTLPSGTLTDAATGLKVNEGFEWTLINLSTSAANTLTLAAGAGHTIVGPVILAAADTAVNGVFGSVATFYTRKTAANTFITYRKS